jgi:hypothetical protein
MSATTIVRTARSGEAGKIVTAREAVRLIRTSDTVRGDAGTLELPRAGRANRISVSGDCRGDVVDSSLSTRRRRNWRRP